MLWLLGCGVTTVATPGQGGDEPPPPPTDSGADSAEDTADTTQPPEEEARCGLLLSVEAPYVTEGDPVTLTASCSEGDRAAFEIVISGPSELVQLDGWTAAWQTDLSDGGRHEVYASAQPVGGGPSELTSSTSKTRCD